MKKRTADEAIAYPAIPFEQYINKVRIEISFVYNNPMGLVATTSMKPPGPQRCTN